jgi:cellulose synthase operon protein YhjU
MGLWSFYFLGKFYLYFRGFIHFDFALNLLFFIFLVIPLPTQLVRYHKGVAVVRLLFCLILGLLLLWHDSWLPSIRDSLSFVNQEGLPSKEYLYRFILGFLNLLEVAVLAAIFIFCMLVRNRIKLTPVVLAVILIIPLSELGQYKDDAGGLDSFYRSEAARVIQFDKSEQLNPDFDIIILHICSLAWDDLKAVALEESQFFKQFDYLFTNFNSVTAYSNPSSIRLLRADCGQSSHDALYNEAPTKCYLFDALREQGYQTYFTLNHDGVYGHFAQETKRLGHLDEPLLPAGLDPLAYNFDESAIYDDYAVLENWWKVRQEAKSRRAAVYYNTITMHDGHHRVGEKNWWKRNRLDDYREFAQKLFADITRFSNLVASSGRNAVIMFVPEHGLSLRGSKLQAPGLRDIPLPSITIVPVAIKLVGKGHNHVSTQVISNPTSYFSLSYLLAAFFKHNPFAPNGLNTQIIRDIPETDFVAENQGVRLVKKGADYLLYGKEKKWIKLPPNAAM